MFISFPWIALGLAFGGAVAVLVGYVLAFAACAYRLYRISGRAVFALAGFMYIADVLSFIAGGGIYSALYGLFGVFALVGHLVTYSALRRP